MNLKQISILGLVMSVLLLIPQSGLAQAEREVIDLSERGPQVGETIPDFSLTDQYGETWTRDRILGENGTMLVFIRSANW
jgi:hypothetical protein